MVFSEIIDILKTNLGANVIVEYNDEATQPYIVVQPKDLLLTCQELYSNPELLFDYLACLSGVDLEPKEELIEVIYHLDSLPLKHSVVLKTRVDRLPLEHCKIPSVTSIWKGANWHERETFDFFGVQFTDHPALRRILLPTNWEGHPLRKDYKEQEYFHGIKVKY